jgi:hypothetical protein
VIRKKPLKCRPVYHTQADIRRRLVRKPGLFGKKPAEKIRWEQESDNVIVAIDRGAGELDHSVENIADNVTGLALRLDYAPARISPPVRDTVELRHRIGREPALQTVRL